MVGLCTLVGAISLAATTSAVAASTTKVTPGTAAAKPAGYTIVASGVFTAQAGLEGLGTVTCPKTKGVQTYPLSGGALGSGDDLAENINSSWPTTKGWSVDMNNAGASAAEFQVYAVCAKKLSGYVLRKSKSVANPAGKENEATYSCPSGDEIFGGGVFSASSQTSVNIASEWPSDDASWVVYVNNASGQATSFHVYEICAKVNTSSTHYQVVSGTVVSNPSDEETIAVEPCPSGLSVLSGGVVSSSLLTSVNLNSTYPESGEWVNYENNASTAGDDLTAFAVCAS
jgi:hypothetical protein